jgi:alpha-beta hydrolase superfamily lysophospholipase
MQRRPDAPASGVLLPSALPSYNPALHQAPAGAALRLPSPAALAEQLQALQTEVVQVPHQDGLTALETHRVTETEFTSELILTYLPDALAKLDPMSKIQKKLSPSSTCPALRGIVLFPHGGPHSAYTTAYDFVSAMFALQGFAVAKVNYRGSCAYGEEALNLLPGRCGAMDVDDCVNALHIAQQQLAALLTTGATVPIGGGKPGEEVAFTGSAEAVQRVKDLPVQLFGGSHGGFLVTHLIGQYPNLFAGCVARNPVVNLAYTVGTSDIADWCFVEAGRPFTADFIVSRDDMMRFYDVSPLRYMEHVKTPTLLAIGTNDRRVPPQQSYDMFRALQSRGVPCKLSVYHDAQHSLNEKPMVHADSIMCAMAWFLRFKGRSVGNLQKYLCVR